MRLVARGDVAARSPGEREPAGASESERARAAAVVAACAGFVVVDGFGTVGVPAARARTGKWYYEATVPARGFGNKHPQWGWASAPFSPRPEREEMEDGNSI